MRRSLFTLAAAVAAVAALGAAGNAPRQAFDFERDNLNAWQIQSGNWQIEGGEQGGADSGQHDLVLQGSSQPMNVIVAPAGPFGDIDAGVKFRARADKGDRSAGIVFRFANGRYYLLRAAAGDDQLRLDAVDGSDVQSIASGKVTPPALHTWHTLRVVASGDHIEGYLDDVRAIDERDARLDSGRVGLWAGADAVTAFDDLAIKGSAPAR